MSGDPARTPADLRNQLLSWARGAEPWWTPAQAAGAIGAHEDEVRSALAALEAEGFAHRSILRADAWTLTMDGKERA